MILDQLEDAIDPGQAPLPCPTCWLAGGKGSHAKTPEQPTTISWPSLTRGLISSLSEVPPPPLTPPGPIPAPRSGDP